MKIDKGIPIPQYNNNRRRNKYDLQKMKIGDSFIHPGSFQGARSVMFRNRLMYGYEFVTKTTHYGNQRIWRVK